MIRPRAIRRVVVLPAPFGPRKPVTWPGSTAPGSAVVSLTDGGLATSGTRARRWLHGGVEVHHLLDPRTGLPAAPFWRTVGVAADSCAGANAASTDAAVLGQAAVPWLGRLGLPARLVSEHGDVLTTGGWPA
ncbi:hypothetical protein GCM10023162_37060 [Klenkia terrae]